MNVKGHFKFWSTKGKGVSGRQTTGADRMHRLDFQRECQEIFQYVA
jgi:hypothetical protein